MKIDQKTIPTARQEKNKQTYIVLGYQDGGSGGPQKRHKSGTNQPSSDKRFCATFVPLWVLSYEHIPLVMSSHNSLNASSAAMFRLPRIRTQHNTYLWRPLEFWVVVLTSMVPCSRGVWGGRAERGKGGGGDGVGVDRMCPQRQCPVSASQSSDTRTRFWWPSCHGSNPKAPRGRPPRASRCPLGTPRCP